MRAPWIVLGMVVTLAACSGAESTGRGPDAEEETLSWPDTTADGTGGEEGTSSADVDEAAACEATCDEEGRRECVPGGTRECRYAGGSDCLAWASPVACPGGQICADGQCVAPCADAPCTVAGARSCLDPGTIVTCVDVDDDGCLEWGQAAACGEALVCSNGQCSATCSDECTVVGSRRCEGPGWVECGQWDGDPCLEWGSITTCDTGSSCASGYCVAGCQDECGQSGQTSCAGNAVRTCGDTDPDACLEWGTPVPCTDGKVCVTGTCQAAAQAPAVLLNEVYYDGVGSDADSFVELRGPAGTSLEGFTVVGVNGSDGADYHSVALVGSIGADGLFVLMDATAPAAWTAVADQLGDADLQNGPDSVQLRFGGVVVDALAYGAFAATEFPAGEGSPAPDVKEQSLGRDASGTDADDNAADWTAQEPTPGQPNQVDAPMTPVAPGAKGQVVISELMVASQAGDDPGEWIELLNPGAVPLELSGCVLADDTNTHAIAASLVLQPGAFAVLALSADPALNHGLTVDYVWSGFKLSNQGEPLSLTCGGTLIDDLLFTGAWVQVGVAFQLSSAHLDATANDDDANWCPATSPYGNDGLLGTPGKPNAVCPTQVVGSPTAAGQIVFSEVMAKAQAGSGDKGEWFEVYNPTAGALDLDGCVLADSANEHPIAGPVVVDSHGYGLMAVSGDPALNFGLVDPYVWSGFALSNDGEPLSLTCGGVLIDRIELVPAQVVEGVASQLSADKLDGVSNDTTANWCAAIATYGTAGKLGTPGTANAPCP